MRGTDPLELTKLSMPALAACARTHVALSAGAALGHGVGPLVVVRDDSTVQELASLRGMRVAVPGANTTALLLLRLDHGWSAARQGQRGVPRDPGVAPARLRRESDVGNDGRRLLLTLAHVHGTLLALVQLAFAATMPAGAPRLGRAASCLRWAAVLMPLGFLAAGVFALGADPGLAIVLVPVGGALLLVGVFFAASAASARAGD